MHEWIANGKITDVKTIISVYHLERKMWIGTWI
jgi:ADP-ribose pyrophosphatase